MLAVFLLGVPALLPPTAHRAAPRARCQAPVLQVRPGGDLEGGLDKVRNAQLSALKKLFYGASAAEDSKQVGDTVGTATDVTSGPGSEKAAAAKLGLFLDLPLCRWSMVFLPHTQARART